MAVIVLDGVGRFKVLLVSARESIKKIRSQNWGIALGNCVSCWRELRTFELDFERQAARIC